MKTHYKLLSLEVDASAEEIKKAYRNLAKTFHPDKHNNNAFAEECFKKLTEAYEVLSDNKKRAAYDEILIQSWLTELCDQRVLSLFDTGLGTYHRISSAFNVHVPIPQSDILRKEYDPEVEKGGLFLLSVQKTNSDFCLTLEEITVIANTSSRPAVQYIPDTVEFVKAISRALTKNLIPCFFHTHPTKNDNLILESLAYNQQMDTSEADKLASLYTIRRGQFNLRLPEFLVIGNGSMKSGLFIGMYGGLVAPLSFTARKDELMNNWRKDTGGKLEAFFNQTWTWKQWLATGGAAFLLLKYPKQALTVLAATAVVLPPIIYDTSDKNVHFGIAHHSPLIIYCPILPDDYVRNDELTIHDILNNERRSNQKAA